MKIRRLGNSLALFLILAGVFIAASLRIYLRVEATMIGYEIGQLKKAEAEKLEHRSLLRMRLAQLTSRRNLMHFIEAESTKGEPFAGKSIR